MKAELQKYLIEEYQEFFEYLKEHKGPIIPIQFGFEVDDGWFPILDEIMGNIQNHIKNENMSRENVFRHKFPKWLQRKAFRLSYKRKKLIKFIRWLADKFPRGIAPMEPIHITQIKEKFGGLCFYYNGGDKYIDGIVSMGESMSYRTCEICGTTKDIGMTQGWLRVVCKSCMKTDEWCKDREWKPNVLNIYKEAQDHMNKLLDEQNDKKSK